jgi:hypothetical protein
MADSEYPDDVQFAGLVQAATAAADEQMRTPSALGKRKRDDGVLEQVSAAFDDDLGEGAPHPTTPSTSSQLQSSASILFREPSSKSRKYSRPPLGKVFASLELAPENFLRLQNAAKAFMLDEAHPERREVVGHKKNIGGSDVAKLNLWNCVEEFLTVHGYGEKYWAPGAGDDIPGAPQRTLFWPQDRQTIIKMLMPLMRKMVTNERQRMYAAATRKQGTGKNGVDEQTPVEPDESNVAEDDTVNATGPEPGNHQVDSQPPVSVPRTNLSSSNNESHPSPTFKQSTVLYVNVVSIKAGALRRIIPRFDLAPESAPSLSSLISEVDKRRKTAADNADLTSEFRPTVKVWLPDGLVTVAEDGEWMVALLSAGVVDWMDGEVRVLVEV